MKCCKRSPEGALRTQAGVKPLLKMTSKEALKGRQSVLSPLRGWGNILLLTGVPPLPVVFSGLRPLGWETSNSNRKTNTTL